MRLPDFQGRELRLEPPFSFHEVSACVFPLRASLNTLQSLCDRHLNIIPRELGYFQASVPYVYLMVLDYGRLALRVTNLGWFAQREVTFAVPVEWYRWIDGEWVFKEWAIFSPFVYVDDTVSMTLGRSVHGWPKTFASMNADVSGWLRDPSGLSTDVALSTNVFSRTYEGRKLEERVFLEVRSPGAQGFRVPADAENPWFPWTLASNMARNAFGFSRDYMNVLSGLGELPFHEASGPRNDLRRIGRVAEQFFPFWPNVSAATLNLKQFRLIENPERYCYQALTSGPIRYTALNRGGPLGDAAISSGDISGGYSIRLSTYPTTPLVETLGLEVDHRLTNEEVQFVELKPVMPFWYNVDMEYERATTVAWRTDEGVWHDECGYRYEPEGGRDAPGENLFNTTLGAGSPVIPGPFRFSSVVTHVIPLLARRKDLEKYLNERLNVPIRKTGECFELWGATDDQGSDLPDTAHVYMVFSNYGGIQSRGNNVGDWANLCVAFYIPVLHCQYGKVVGIGFTPVTAFADTMTQACTLSEFYGISAIKAEFGSTGGDWLERDRDARAARLQIEAEVLPALGEGQKTRRATVISVGELQPWRPRTQEGLASARERGAYEKLAAQNRKRRNDKACEWLDKKNSGHSSSRSPLVSSQRPSTTKDSIDAATVKAILEDEQPWTLFTLMQIRDAANPSKACYQALHRVSLSIRERMRLEPLGASIPFREHAAEESAMFVDITDYPSLHLVEDLGLVPSLRLERNGVITYRLTAQSPFTIVHSYEQGDDEATRAYHRTDDGDWQRRAEDDEGSSSSGRRNAARRSSKGSNGEMELASLSPQTLIEKKLKADRDAKEKANKDESIETQIRSRYEQMIQDEISNAKSTPE